MTSRKYLQLGLIAICQVLSSNSVMTRCDAAISQPQIYWVASDSIVRSNVDGSGVSNVVNESVSDLVVDSRTNTIYGASYEVWRSNLDGGGRTSLFHTDGWQIYTSIAFDQLRDHLYFSDAITSTIYRTNLDGTNATIIVPSDGLTINHARIEHMRIDADAEKIYWTYEGKTFRRSNLDGSEQETLFTVTDWVQDFRLDSGNSKIYWASSTYGPTGGSVNRANLDGSQQETLVSGDLWGVYGLALDLNAGKMYFTDGQTYGPSNYDGTISVANLDGTGVQTIINTGPNTIPAVLAIDTQIVSEPCTIILFIVASCCVGLQRRRCPIATA